MPLARLRITAAMLLILGLLGAPPASTAEAYQESPWLRDDVSAGRLPPVGERLPADPLVVDLKAQGKEIGKPGGTLRMMIGQGSDARSLLPFAYSRLIVYDENYRLTPDILASFDVQEGRIFTFHLREGHRWSDGSPFTTEDFRYYWEDIATNPKLSPDGLPPALLVNGMPPQVEILDPDDDPLHLGPAQPGLPAGAGGGHAADDLSPGPLPEAVQSQIHQLQGDHAVPGR